jgi:hypothetical protein
MPRDLHVGDKVIAVGYRHGRTLAIASGNVKALHWYDGAPVLQVSAPFDHGQSGGALFDARGRLVGITAFKAVAGGDFHFALPLEWLPTSAILDDTVIGGGQDTGQKAFWERTRDRQPLFLRAASLEAAGKWDTLSEVAQEWGRVDQANPAPWLALGRAFTRLKRQNDADEAYRWAAWLERSAATRLWCPQDRAEERASGNPSNPELDAASAQTGRSQARLHVEAATAALALPADSRRAYLRPNLETSCPLVVSVP